METEVVLRKIIHVDMDAFYASVEQMDNPELKGKPLAVGGSEIRGVVSAASYEARKFGVRSAMSGAQAARLCADLIFVKPNFERYKEVSKQIRKLGDDKVRFKLALSLHAANDKKRNEIMPINETNNIKVLVDAMNYFYKQTGNEITFEYILFKNFNDSQKDAEELVKLFRQVPADLVNIIEYNPIDTFNMTKPDEEGIEDFMNYLEANRVNARLRRSRGKDIDAACGQLANKGK